MSSKQKDVIRVIIIDDHPVVRMGLSLVIDQQPDMQVVGEAGSRAQALAVATALHPDIALLDLDLGADNGLALLLELGAVAPELNVLIITGLRDVEAQRTAVRTGAMGVVMKDTAMETVVKAIRRVHAGEIWLDRSTIERVLQSEVQVRELGGPTAPPGLDTLTPRERELIIQVSAGLKNQQIADRLCISEATVRHHLTSIFSKLDVADRLGLVIYAFRHGLVNFQD